MTHIHDLLSSEWATAFGWTLLHSIWQSALVLSIVLVLLRCIPTMRSARRYAVACGGLLMFFIASVTTYNIVHEDGSKALLDSAAPVSGNVHVAYTADTAAPDMVSYFAATIERSMPLILAVWALGISFFGVRLGTGLLHTSKIRSSAVPLDNEWTEFVAEAARKLGVERLISLAESTAISAPVVIGYFKPVILVPMGMLSGLTTEQVETILLHELAHIKRHDYLINLVQSVIESMFFFNPFVWILGKVIRQEREYCCDDLVIDQHGGARAYAHALVQLAEARLSSNGFALSLADDKNQLLNRIKRIMEKSVQNYSGRGRLVIAASLLLGALLCISWLGSGNNPPMNRMAGQDTIPDQKEKRAHYSRKSIITLDENGQPREEIVEEFEGDESLREMLQQQIPALPDISTLPAIPDVPMAPMLPDFALPMIPDSLPVGLRNMDRWEEFAREFEENFRKRFEMLDHFHDGDTAAFGKHFEDKFTWLDWESFEMPDHFEESLRTLEDSYEHLDEELKRFEEQRMEHFRDFQAHFDFENDFTGRYQDRLRQELIRDGYLSEDERIESLEWNNSVFKVNGKTIKRSDEQKYRKLKDEFFGGSKEPKKLE